MLVRVLPNKEKENKQKAYYHGFVEKQMFINNEELNSSIRFNTSSSLPLNIILQYGGKSKPSGDSTVTPIDIIGLSFKFNLNKHISNIEKETKSSLVGVWLTEKKGGYEKNLSFVFAGPEMTKQLVNGKQRPLVEWYLNIHVKPTYNSGFYNLNHQFENFEKLLKFEKTTISEINCENYVNYGYEPYKQKERKPRLESPKEEEVKSEKTENAVDNADKVNNKAEVDITPAEKISEESRIGSLPSNYRKP